MKKILFIVIACLCWTAYTSPAFGEELTEIDLSVEQVGKLTSNNLSVVIESSPHLVKIDLGGQKTLQMWDVVYLLSSLDLQWISLRDMQLEPDSDAMMYMHPRLSSLQYVDASNNSPSAILSLFEAGCPEVNELKYTHKGKEGAGAGLSNSQVAQLLSYFPAVEAIDISGHPLTDYGIRTLLNTNQIHSLSFRDSDLNGLFALYLENHVAETLQYLDLSQPPSREHDPGLLAAISEFPHLHTLKLGKISPQDLTMIVENKLELQELHLKKFFLTEDSLLMLARNCPALQLLDCGTFNFNEIVSEYADATFPPETLEEAQELCPGLEVKSGIILENPQSNSDVWWIAQAMGPCLTELKITNIWPGIISMDDLEDLLNATPNLQELDLQGSYALAKVVYEGLGWDEDYSEDAYYHRFILIAAPTPPPIDSSFFHRLKKHPPLTKLSLKHFSGFYEQFLETLPELFPTLQDIYLEIPVIDTFYLEMIEAPQDWRWPNQESILNDPPTHEEILHFAERFPNIAVHCYQVSYPLFRLISELYAPKPDYYVGKRWPNPTSPIINPKITEILK